MRAKEKSILKPLVMESLLTRAALSAGTAVLASPRLSGISKVFLEQPGSPLGSQENGHSCDFSAYLLLESASLCYLIGQLT